MWRVAICFVLLASVAYLNAQIDPQARRDIDAGNQAWIDSMKSGVVTALAATYAADAVDCGPTGDCLRGQAIKEHLLARSSKMGKATSAAVKSQGSSQQSDYVYEWGHAEAAFSNGKRIAGRYLTVWKKQSDGHWKIFRNMSIPEDQP